LIDARRNLRSLQSEKARLEEKIENIKDVIGGNEKEDIKDLFRKGILYNKKSTGEMHCSLDTGKLNEINEIENS